MDFYSKNIYLSLIDNKKKIKVMLIIVNVIGLLSSILLYSFTNRSNALIMKILICSILIIMLYIDCYLYFDSLKKNRKMIKHFDVVYRYEEERIENFTLVDSMERFTKDGILFVVIEIEKNNQKQVLYLKEDCFSLLEMNKIKVIYTKGNFINKVECGE